MHSHRHVKHIAAECSIANIINKTKNMDMVYLKSLKQKTKKIQELSNIVELVIRNIHSNAKTITSLRNSTKLNIFLPFIAIILII